MNRCLIGCAVVFFGARLFAAGTYCIVDLSAGAAASRYPVAYRDDVPAGGWTDAYRTDKLVLRRIPGASPCYIGVFEVTQRQYELVTGGNPSQLKGAMRPVERVSWEALRGRTADFGWPAVKTVSSDGFIGRLRARTGLPFDLPTEAQWECACRAGTASVYGNGGNAESDLRKMGRYGGNRADGRGGFAEHTKVGSYAPNAWGLYDLHGNVWEWCLDPGRGNPKDAVRMIRGGCWAGPAETCASAHRTRYISWPWCEDAFYGFRLALNADGPAAVAPSVPGSAPRICPNPIAPEGRFLADPAGRVGPDGVLRLFCSHDDNAKTFCSAQNDVLSTADMAGWKLAEGVFWSAAIGNGVKPTTALYAPDGIFHDGKWRLFYCTPDARHAEGVAEAASAEGPYGAAHPFAFCRQIDPSVFRDDDGTLYLYWGQFTAKCAKLKPDLSDFEPGTVRESVLDAQHHHFHEGVQAFKRGGLYYLAYADVSRGGRPGCIGYATAPTPLGPFTYRGVIIDNAGSDPCRGNNHGSVVEFGGRWYVFYHRQSNGVGCLRKACVEPIAFDADGLIREVEMTSNGAGAPLDPFSPTEARLACGLEGNVRVTTLADGQERLTGIRDGDAALWRYFDFREAAGELGLEAVAEAGAKVRVYDGAGVLHGEGAVAAGDGRSLTKTTIRLTRPFAKGLAAVRLVFAGEKGRPLLQLESFSFARSFAMRRFEAGSSCSVSSARVCASR